LQPYLCNDDLLYLVTSGSVAVTIRKWAASEQPGHEYANGTLICLFVFYSWTAIL
jgi:hypothetical protein